VINWMLEVEEVEDVACTVDDMEAMNRSLSLVQRIRGDGMREGGTRKLQRVRSHCLVTVLGAGGARLCITALFGRGSRGSAE
jgi:hypothetical protein